MSAGALLIHSKLPREMFRSAPLSIDTDFTAEDPLALDYLGQQVGNWLFRGFTTRTTRAQYYAVVLYGLHLADVAIARYRYPADDSTRNQLFERWERFWALATVESRGGAMERGDPDAMRGVRGARREWKSGDQPLRLDFPLISRQLELGGLGAYLSSLRDYRLVGEKTLRPTPLAQEILDAFWAEPGKRAKHRQEEFAFQALDRYEKEIPRAANGLTLRGIGEASRLSSIVNRREQQNRLWKILFQDSTDGSTLPLARQLIAANKHGVVDAEQLLEGMLAGKWGELNSDCIEKIKVALAFGRLARFLLDRFDRVYECVHQRGLADLNDVLQAAFPDAVFAQLRPLCDSLLEAADSRKFNQLDAHGSQFMALVQKLQGAGRHACLEHLLSFHRSVQKTRRGSGAWLQDEQGKLVLNGMSYNGHKSISKFPSFKLDVVLRLLDDLGRLG